MTIIASILLVFGVILLRNKRSEGFALQVIGSILMIIHFAFFLYPIDWAIVVLNVVFAVLSLEAAFKWERDKTLDNKQTTCYIPFMNKEYADIEDRCGCLKPNCGYGIFTVDGSRYLKDGTLALQKCDECEIFECDEDAALFARSEGINCDTDYPCAMICEGCRVNHATTKIEDIYLCGSCGKKFEKQLLDKKERV